MFPERLSLPVVGDVMCGDDCNIRPMILLIRCLNTRTQKTMIPVSKVPHRSLRAKRRLENVKAAKLQAKAERKAMREQELIEREERKRREKEKEEKLEKEREREREEEKLEQERLMKEKEEREKRELEEYLAMKASFAVEEEGFDQIEEEESNNLMNQFVEYVKTSKIVNMDELAAHFGLKSDEVISRLHYFLDNGLLQGVMDDRGKFICITDDELNAVAKFINQRGRITIQELAEYSNRLIRLES
ncbi:hypothetical protein KIN20_032326 [Parelaphostrongylus tenuis]|uniref:DDRGK domain-containing protein 1 n=1 Tax=Parelaphostrongylus tenuis TaxID=148309 RepID=A0AAD5R6W6_PARTN|nr:hypothetical protein KIN20_032326 [Parelaphostrongylus tenuis]